MLGLVIAVESLFHFFKFITAGSNRELKNQAQAIPAPITIAYPKSGSIGDSVIVANAAIVVILVRKIGINSESIVAAIAFLESCFNLNSLKNLETT